MAVLAGVGLLAVWATCDPSTHVFYPPCPFRVLTGLECPGCGTMRAGHALLRGRPIEAFRLNPLLVPTVLVALVLTIKRSWFRHRWTPAILFGLLVLAWLLRLTGLA